MAVAAAVALLQKNATIALAQANSAHTQSLAAMEAALNFPMSSWPVLFDDGDYQEQVFTTDIDRVDLTSAPLALGDKVDALPGHKTSSLNPYPIFSILNVHLKIYP